MSILFLLAALEAGQPHCYLKDSARNENISIVARDGYQVLVRFTDGSIAYVDDDNLVCGAWRYTLISASRVPRRTTAAGSGGQASDQIARLGL